MDLEALTADSFAPYTGAAFKLSGSDGETAFHLTLTEVTEAPSQGVGRRQFSLIFRGGPDPPVPQRIYRLEHGELGALEIFLVPIGSDGDGQRYQAVFT